MDLESDDSAILVQEYYDKMLLKDMGYTFDSSKLSDFSVGVYKIIASERNRISKQKANKK